MLIDIWHREYNSIRPHTPLSYRPTEPETFTPVVQHEAALA